MKSCSILSMILHPNKNCTTGILVCSGKRGMGRKKISIARISDERNRCAHNFVILSNNIHTLHDRFKRTRCRVFFKYCVFSKILIYIFRTLFSLDVSVCTHTRQVEHQRCSRTGRVQKIKKKC